MGSISKAIKRVIPKEIQPILPIAASMFGGPLVGSLIGKSALGSGIMSALGPIGGRALTSGLTSAATDLLTSGKIDARNVGIAALMGGGGQYLKGDPNMIGPKTGFQNIKSEIGEAIAPDVTNMSKLSDLTTPLSVATTTGGSIAAYDAAEEAQRKYEEEMAGREADSAADRQSRIDYITRYMGLAGFSQSEIDEALSNAGYQNGGRVGFSSGGSGTLGDSMQAIKIRIMKNQIIDAGGGGFGGKDLDDKTDDEIIEIYEGLFSQGKANGGRIGYSIGGGPVKSFIAKLLKAEPSEEVLNKMFEERKKEILSGMFDAEAGTGAYSMEQMQKADEMATKQAMQELEEFKMRIGMELDNPPEGSMSDDMIDQIMDAREKSNRTPGERAKEDLLQYDSPVPMNVGDTLLDKFMLEDFQDTIKKQKKEQKEEGSRFADGGRIKYAEGGTDYSPTIPFGGRTSEFFLNAIKEAKNEKDARPGYGEEERSKTVGDIIDPDSILKYLFPFDKFPKGKKKIMKELNKLLDEAERDDERDPENKGRYYDPERPDLFFMKNGGIMNLKMGGMPAEMDLRGGGFVPLGAKEKADDVPARLSKNEFVMTADAVRAAGGGSVNKGAKRMYNLMNNLEARV